MYLQHLVERQKMRVVHYAPLYPLLRQPLEQFGVLLTRLLQDILKPHLSLLFGERLNDEPLAIGGYPQLRLIVDSKHFQNRSIDDQRGRIAVTGESLNLALSPDTPLHVAANPAVAMPQAPQP
jgi:hypothetical protein